MSTRVFGAIMLIVGTSVGGGMLALPIATAHMGFLPALAYLLVTWLAMTFGALLVLEVNSWLPQNSNLISMAGATIGRLGQALAWVAYLLLFYCLLAAYLAGGQEVLTVLLGYVGIKLSGPWAVLLFLALFSSVVARGIKHVDWLNRVVMVVKLTSYVGLVLLTLPAVQVVQAVENTGDVVFSLPVVMVMITAYGFAVVVPSLRHYLHDNLKLLRQTVMIGSLIPLTLYVLWEFVILSVLPTTGPHSLQTLAHAKQPVAALMQALSQLSHSGWLAWFANVFTSVCVITAFLGVSLCLLDFLADGFGVRKSGRSGVLLYLATFVPPLLLVLTAKRVFVYGLSLAGSFCVFLLMLLPAWMAWVGRYQKDFPAHYRVVGGRFTLLLIGALSVALLVANIVEALGV